ncbi:glycosyltransferase [Hyphococcus formosus]|uniref:glycosyltransferase n=1 Tax=Hyphococcus formosus TaxID=3143534 RepID=UPI00398A5205
MKIAVIGPVPPFRSGIARHTAALTDALRAYGEVNAYSFARQYPRFLFPGENDKDASARIVDADFCIDTINPLTWHRAIKKIIADQPDMVVIPAWTFFVAPCLRYIAGGLRNRGANVVSIVHNAADHEASAWKNWLLKKQIKAADGIVTHTTALAKACERINKNANISVSPHPLFDYPAATGSLPRRSKLELLMFGLMRPYKGADILVDALARCKQHDIHLSIVGEFWSGEQELRALIKSHHLDDRIEIIPRYVADQDAAEFFHRADVVVLPYTEVTGSGVVPVAFHYGKPVITSDLEGFHDLVQENVTGWRVAPGDPDALASAIKARAEQNDANDLRAGIADMCRSLSWPAFAKSVVGVAPSHNVNYNSLALQAG